LNAERRSKVNYKRQFNRRDAKAAEKKESEEGTPLSSSRGEGLGGEEAVIQTALLPGPTLHLYETVRLCGQGCRLAAEGG